MSGGGLIASVEVTHRLRSRVRFRCRFQVGQAADWPKLETLASGFRGVRTARANARALSLTLEFDPELTDEWQLGHALLEISDSATATISTSIPEDHATRNALIASAAVLLGGSFLPRILKFCVSLAAAAPLLREAGEDLVEKQVSSRVLEGLAIAISIARGDYRVANTTNFLLAAGTHLSATTARRSDELLRDLLRPHNPFVWVVRDGKEVEIDADDVTIGDTVIIAAGSVVPVDGRVLSGVASINEAALTGEALPVEKTHGDKVLSGSLVVEGRIAIYAESVGAGTVTARIAEYVQRSLASQGQKQLETARLADKLVPIILSAASGSVLLSGNLKRPASV
ncbi:MAG: HAD-IC family P-type ATPase, partial [Pseudomonadota bacterium]